MQRSPTRFRNWCTGTGLVATTLCVAPALLGCPSTALRGTHGAQRSDDGRSAVHVHNASARELTLVVGVLRDPTAFDCALLLEGEQLSAHAFALRTIHLAPGENLGVQGLAGDGSLLIGSRGDRCRPCPKRALPFAFAP